MGSWIDLTVNPLVSPCRHSDNAARNMKWSKGKKKKEVGRTRILHKLIELC